MKLTSIMPDNSTAKKVKPFLILKPMKKHQSTLRVVVTLVGHCRHKLVVWVLEKFDNSQWKNDRKKYPQNSVKLSTNWTMLPSSCPAKLYIFFWYSSALQLLNLCCWYSMKFTIFNIWRSSSKLGVGWERGKKNCFAN